MTDGRIPLGASEVTMCGAYADGLAFRAPVLALATNVDEIAMWIDSSPKFDPQSPCSAELGPTYNLAFKYPDLGQVGSAQLLIVRQAIPNGALRGTMLPMARTTVYWTDRFQDHYRSYSGARAYVVRTVRNAVRRRESVKDWYDGKRAMQGVQELVYELKATSSDRILVRVRADKLYLVDIGDHDITHTYARRPKAAREADFKTATEAPDSFHPENDAPLFIDADDPPDYLWEEEFGKEWLHFLGQRQGDVKQRMIPRINASIGERGADPYVGIVTGGAGTGKTALLLSLALDYAELGWVVDFRCSNAMRSYLNDHAGVNMSKLRPAVGQSADLVLLDDPGSVDQVRSAVTEARALGIGGLVTGFDPLQWWDDKFLADRLPALDGLGEPFLLSECYRQSANLVERAQRLSRAVNEKSSWRADASKVSQEREFLGGLLAQYSDGLTTVKTGGRVKHYDRVTTRAIKDEADFARDIAGIDELPALLILHDSARDVDLRPEWTQPLKERGVRYLTRKYKDVNSYKGLDFPAVWAFLGAELIDRLQEGKLGLNKVEWSELRSLHVALTRAKEAIAIFTVPGPPQRSRRVGGRR